VKKLLLKIYYWPCLAQSRIDENQKKIRDKEWDEVKEYIQPESKLLDVGCGAGYNLIKAQEELDCKCFGVDPDPGGHGVGRYDYKESQELNIQPGFAENIPFEDNSFDVVICSHVLEHVKDKSKSLQEINRVLKEGGVLIIGMPTAAMAWVNLLTQWLFTTHMRFANFFLSPFINTGKTKFKHLFFPPSHSYSDKTVLYDIKNYKVKKWKTTVASEFNITNTLQPYLYPYPEYLQLFKMYKSSKWSSSVFFICKKR
jgi:ubiquinone/menaquinone biosynthesis C-methylase UbiE